ncbi:MAG: hypothetical protein KUG75_13515 [Pseudomonadales bacterium]|nr:hypothetical protein [Pseudomonadales bacterium]
MTFSEGSYIKTFKSCFLTVFVFVLVACGGGGGSTNIGSANSSGSTPVTGGGSNPNVGGDTGTGFGGGISGSGIVHSRIQGFGSVIISDDEYDTFTTTFIVEGDDNAIQDELDIGKVITVDVDFENKVANAISYRSSLKGPIDNIVITDLLKGEALITALGQSILTNAATHFQNLDLALYLAGDLIEVSGVRDENDNIIASYVEKKPSLDEFKLIGSIRNLRASELNIGSLRVDYSSAALQNFDSNLLAEDQLVEVKAPASGFTSPDSLIASSLEFIPLTLVSGDDRLEIEGVITRFASELDFDISGFSVTTSETKTTYVNGGSSSLEVGAFIEAEGGVNQAGVLEAVNIVFKPTGAVRVESTVESIDLPGRRVNALGISFVIRDSTQFEDESAANVSNLSLVDFNVGDRIELRAFLDGATLVASKVEREDSEDEVSLSGPVTAIDAAGSTIDILGITITSGENTQYEIGEQEDLNQSVFYSSLRLGDFVEAEWEAFISIEDVVDSLEIENE